MTRNKEVEACIAKVINEWMTADRAYSFESRIFGKLQFPNPLNGAANELASYKKSYTSDPFLWKVGGNET